MMENVWRICLVLLSIGEIYLGYQVLFFCCIDQEELETRHKVLMWGTILVQGTLTGINRGMFWFSHWMFLLQIALVAIGIIGISRGKKIHAIVVEETYFSVLALLDFIVIFIIMGIKGREFLKSIFWEDSGYKVWEFLLVRVCVILFFSKAEKKKEEIREIVLQCKIQLIVLGISLIVGLRMYQNLFAEYISTGQWDSVWGIWIPMILIAILFIGIFSVLLKEKNISKQLEVEQLRDRMVEENYNRLQEIFEESRTNLHDMKHHLWILKEYSERNDLESIRRYLEEVEKPINEIDQMIKTKYEILDFILNQKCKEAKKEKIDIRISVSEDLKLPLTDREICSVFGNLLDNAIEACKKIEKGNRSIYLSLNCKVGMTFLEVTNTIMEKPQRVNGSFISSRKGNGHGWGIKSVERIVKKNNGEMDFEVTDEQFMIRIIFAMN